MKKSERWKRGLPYVGNKSRYIDKIIKNIPSAHEFVDVFGGGGCASLFASDSGKFDKVRYNELDTGVFTLFSELTNGNLEAFDFRYIGSVSRDQFFSELYSKPTKTDDIVRRQIILLSHSFSNDRHSYLWGKKIEKSKLDTCRYVLEHTTGTLEECAAETKNAIVKYTTKTDRLVNIERLRGIESITKKRGCYDRISTTNKDYRDLSISDDAVIYCDPPYKNTTNKYTSEFDFDAFQEWLQSLPNEHVFISSYECPRGCELVDVVGKPRRAFTQANSKRVEKLYRLKK